MRLIEKLERSTEFLLPERVGQSKLNKMIRIAFEAVKRFLIIAFIIFLLLAATGSFDFTIAEHQLIQSDVAKQVLVRTTGIPDIKIVGAYFRRIYYDENSGAGLYGAYILPSSKSMAVYAAAEAGSDEAVELLFKMRRLCFVVNNEEAIADTVELRDDCYPSAPKGRNVTLIAREHQYYYQQTYLKEEDSRSEPELLEVDGKTIYSRFSKG